MTTIGSTSYPPTSLYAGNDSLVTMRKVITGEVSVLNPEVPPAGLEGGTTILLTSADPDETGTFLYDQSGKLAEASSSRPTGPSDRFASIHEENLFLRNANKEELAEVYGEKSAQRLIESRERMPQIVEAYEHMIANTKRDNPEFLANTLKDQAQDTVGQIEDNLKLLNMYHQIRDAPDQTNATKTLAATWITRFLGNIQDISEGLRSTVGVVGDLVRQQDDGTYVLSNFTLTYDGAEFFKHQESAATD